MLPTLGSRICVEFIVGEGDYDDSLFNRCHVILPLDKYLRPAKRHSSDQTHNFEINKMEPRYGYSTYGFVQYLYLLAGVVLVAMIFFVRLYTIPCALRNLV